MKKIIAALVIATAAATLCFLIKNSGADNALDLNKNNLKASPASQTSQASQFN